MHGLLATHVLIISVLITLYEAFVVTVLLINLINADTINLL